MKRRTCGSSHVSSSLALPSGYRIIFASRRGPSIPLARLRANGEVAELGTDDLRFDTSETARLFSEAYGRTLEPDVLADLTTRTEGWAASLQLVQAALRDRTPGGDPAIRSRVCPGRTRIYTTTLPRRWLATYLTTFNSSSCRHLSCKPSTPAWPAAVTSLDAAEVPSLTATAERMTLLGRRAGGPRTQLRYHPLVREFLEARLVARTRTRGRCGSSIGGRPSLQKSKTGVRRRITTGSPTTEPEPTK